MKPKISVIMPVFNAEPFLKEAVNSVLAQTFSDFELILIDDGSTDASADMLRSLKDERVRIVSNGVNRGLIFSLNRGLDLAQGEYIARMDADDVSLPDRFAAQVDFLDRNPEIDVCGTWFRTVGIHDRVHKHPARHEEIMEDFLHLGCVIGHPTAMLRKSALGGVRYEPAFEHAEDYRLWAVLSRKSRFANLPRVLVLYRTHAGQISEGRAAAQRLAAERVRAFIAASTIPDMPSDDLRWVERAFGGEGGFHVLELESIRGVLSRLIEANSRNRRFRGPRYNALMARTWLRSCLQHAFDRREGFREFWTAPAILLRAWPALVPIVVRTLLRRAQRRAQRWGRRIRPFKPIVVRLTGDLANQMFQYATAFAYSEETRLKLGIDVSDFALFPRHRYRLDGWTLTHRALRAEPLQAMGSYRVVRERDAKPFGPATRPPSGKGIYLEGEWQSHELFAAHRKLLRGQFRPARGVGRVRLDIIKEFRAHPSMVVLLSPAPFVVDGQVDRSAWPSAADAEYYSRAISRVASSEPALNIAVFAVQRRSFVVPSIPGVTEELIRDVDDQSPEDLYTLSQAKHFIIPSSAFGWWMAWLGDAPGKRVVAPSRWRLLSATPYGPTIPAEWERV